MARVQNINIIISFTGAFQNVAGGNLTGLPRAVHRDLLGFSGCDILECTRFTIANP
jgi:hypothetical protein